jgi:hypothetical protein
LFCFVFVFLSAGKRNGEEEFPHSSSSFLPHTILTRPLQPISLYFLINPCIKHRQHPFLPQKFYTYNIH